MTESPQEPTRIGYVFPWDVVGDPAALDRWQERGIDRLAIAASYHETRAATPLHPRHLFVDAAHAAFYGRRAPWAGLLKPVYPRWIEEDAFGRARDAARAAGFSVAAWTVLTHHDVLGARHPDLCVVSAWGDRYPWALCPSSAAIVEYCSSLVREVVAAGSLDGLVLESAGPMGVDHRGAYDKTDLTGWTARDRALLSLCFCSACGDAYRAGGLDPVSLADGVRATLGRAASALDHAAAIDRAFAVRLESSGALVVETVAAAHEAAPGLRVAMHVGADPTSAGPFPPLHPAAASSLDTLVASGWDPPAAAGNLAALRDLAPDAALGLYVRPEFPAHLIATLEPAPSELHLYHLGLSGQAELEALSQLGRVR